MDNEMVNRRNYELAVKTILRMIGEDVDRDGLKDTPKRVVKMWSEVFRGYDKSQLPHITTFQNGTDGLHYDEMLMDRGKFYSHCEHHMIPFFGKYWFVYIPHPKGKILGLSKVGRVVDYYSAKLQIQERLVHEIVDYLWSALSDSNDRPPGLEEKRNPIAMGLVMEAEHLCKSMRGVKKEGTMRSTKLIGTLQTDPAARAEFMGWVNRK